MKLDYKKTIKVGFAFAIIMIFWTAYDFVVPMLLEKAFGLSNTMRGLVMGLDNLLSLFMLPLFGKLSDKSKTRFGKRTPFIVLGTIATVVLMVFVPISANKQMKEATALRTELTQTIDDARWGGIYEEYADKVYLANNGLDKEDFIEIASSGVTQETKTQEYKNFVESPLNIWLSKQVNEQITQQNIGRIVVYMIILFFVLVCMATFRSPAVALMPDVTPKPVRSQANAIINLMGGLGGALAFVIYTVGFMLSSNPYIGIFATVGGGMLLLMTVFLLLVNENKFVKECEEICAEYEINNEEDAIIQDSAGPLTEEDKKFRKAKMSSFFLILASIFMWFMGYNAITSNLSIYTTRTLNLSPVIASIVSGVSMAISALAFIPVGYLAAKIGRRKSVMLGFILATVSFILVWAFIRPSGAAQYLFTAFYLIAGFGLIIANVNTFPMVVELSRAEDVGKYTGYYYIATMSAQAIAPFVGGLFMDWLGDYSLFAYAAVCVIIATALMFLVKHGDSRPPKKSKLEMLGEDA